MKYEGHVAGMGKMKNAYKTSIEEPGGKRPFGRPKHRWEDNIKIYLKGIRYQDLYWIQLLMIGSSGGNF
jgi:hypothetical protein